MNSQSNAVPESSFQSQGIAPTAVSPGQTLYWSIRRELWENRSIYIAPAAVAALFLFGFVINMLALRHRIGESSVDAAQQHHLLASQYELAAALIMGTALIVGIFYSLDALYGERRDRSILFWKSLPVSDLTTVLSKLAIPIIILPLLSFAITVATQFIMLLLSSGILAGSGVNIAALWREASFFQVSFVLLYHLLTVHGLWYVPLYGWLLLVSAWAPRAPFIWAVLPPFAICGLEKIAFNTSYCLTMLQHRLTGPEAPAATAIATGWAPHDFTASLIPAHFFSTPGPWIGLVVGAAFLFAAVRLRRYQGPI
ncbi:MAG: transporter permease [Candidatus Angelobacter sp.]|nr:transporter permease [Candidatus Angelobacter sp.]